MKRLTLAVLAVSLFAQAPDLNRPLLNTRQVLDLYDRAIQLMESTTVAVPELARAGAPTLQTARQTLANLRLNTNNAELNYTFLMNLRAYLALSDAVAKPFPFPDEGRKQFSELRDTLTRAESHFHALIELKDRQLRNPDPDNLERYADVDSRLGPPKPEKPRVIFFGDSITDFWRLNEYFPERDFVNRGISGQITTQMLGRMEADVIPLQPAAMVILAGTNDIVRGTPLQTIEANLTAIADLADYHKIKIVFASVLPVSDYHKDVNPNYEMSRTRPPATIRALNDWIKRFCTRRGLAYLDYYSEMVDAAGFLKTDLADDGLHPNSAGYRIMAPLALASVDSILRAAPQPVPAHKRRFFGN